MRNTKNLKEYVKELNDLAADWADWAENKKDYWYKEYQTYDIWKKKAQEPTSPKIPNSPDVPKKNVKPRLYSSSQIMQEWWGNVLSGKFDFVIHAGATYRKFMNGDPSSLTNWEMGHCVRKVTYTRLDLAKTQPLFLHNFVMFALPNNYVAFHADDIQFIPTKDR